MADTNALIGTQLKTFPGSYFNSSRGTYTLDASGELAAVIFQVSEAADITGMTAYCTAVASPPAYKFTLQGVDASGDPDGSVKATTAEFTPTGSTTEAHSFVASYSASQGELLAGVWEYSSGTIGASNDASFRSFTKTVRYNLFPYFNYYNGSSWYPDNDSYPAFTLQTDEAWDVGGIYNEEPGTEDVSTIGHRFAQRILIPADEDIELHIDGFYYTGDVEKSAGDDYKAGVWNAAGVELASVSIDAAQQAAAFNSLPSPSRSYTFTADATITAGSVFYIGYEHTGDDLTIEYAKCGGAAGLKSWPGGASFYASLWNGSSWVDDDEKRLCLNPTLSSFHGTGGGGGSTTAATMGVIG